MADEREYNKPDADFAAREDEGDDVEAHGVKPEPSEDRDAAATEEPPDVEAHWHKPNLKP